MIDLFINFIKTILNFEFLGIQLIDYLLAVTLIIFIFKIFKILGDKK